MIGDRWVRGARDGSSGTGVATVLAKEHNECSRARSLLVGGSAFRTYACQVEKETGKKKRESERDGRVLTE